MADQKHKIVKLSSGETIAFPATMPDAQVAGLITAFRQGKFNSPESGQIHTGNLHAQVSPKTTDNSEHLRQSGDVTPQLPAPSWNELRQYVNDKTQPTILPPLQGKLNYSQSAQDINARANNFTQNSMKRAARFLFGVVDMVPQTASTLVNLFSSDPKVSQQAESDLLSMHPGAQISDRGKELVEDWKKSPALAGSNLTGDALGFYLAGRMGPHDVGAVPLDKEPPRFRTRRVYAGPMGDVRVGTDNIPTVWMHPKAWESLMDVLYPGEDAGNTHGMSLGADENLLKLARDKGVSQRPEFKEVQTMLEKAHAAAQGQADSVAIGVKREKGFRYAVRLMREEKNHAWQRSLSQNKRIMTHLSPEGFTEVAKSIPGTMSAHLQFEGYDPQSAPEMVSEAAARMIGGELRGATPEQAGEFLDKYFQQIVKEHGPKALETLEHVRGEGAKAKERINAEHNASQQGATRTGVPEVATGRQGGAGATPEGGTGQTGTTAPEVVFNRRGKPRERAQEGLAVPYKIESAVKTDKPSPYGGRHYDGSPNAEIWTVKTDAGDVDVFVHPGGGEAEAEQQAAMILGQNIARGVPAERLFNPGTYKPTEAINAAEASFREAYQKLKVDSARKIERHTPEDIWKIPEREYTSKGWHENETDEERSARYDREREWQQSALAAISTGKLTPEEAEARGIHTNPKASEFKPLPPVLYHVTTAASDVAKEGLGSRWEVGQGSRGKGLGGGDDRSISFTTDAETANTIRDTIRLARQLSSGEVTPTDLAQYARDGKDAPRPYFDDFKKMFEGNYGSLDNALAGLKQDFGMFGEPPRDGHTDWQPVIDDAFITDAAGNKRYMHWRRPLDKAESDYRKYNMLQTWLYARDHAGGPENPLFFSSDFDGLAKIDPNEIQVLKFSPAPGAKGTQVHALGEWRAYSGKAVKPEAIVPAGSGESLSDRIQSLKKEVEARKPGTENPDAQFGDDVLFNRQKISPQEAKDKKMFGPVFHGTTAVLRDKIGEEGFKVFEGEAESGDIRHGYGGGQYGNTGVPPPVHHLGYGVYLTTVRNIAKKFNEGSGRGLRSYYINAPRIAEINFGSPRTMMKWWTDNGYDPKIAMRDRVVATKMLTETLKSKYDAVWFKGKGMYKLLDGDQIVVFNPDNILEVDNTLTKPGEIGSKVTRKSDGMKGVLVGVREIPEGARQYHKGNARFLEIKWQKGGKSWNDYDPDVEFEGPVSPTATKGSHSTFDNRPKVNKSDTAFNRQRIGDLRRKALRNKNEASLNRDTSVLSDKDIEHWTRYTGSLKFGSEQEARQWMFDKMEREDQSSWAAAFGKNGPEKNHKIADTMPLYRENRKWKIGQKVKPVVSKERLGDERPDGRAPSVNWYDQDLQDSGKRVTPQTILNDYNMPKDRKAVVYQSYIPIGDMPDPVLAEEAYDDEDAGTYDWSDLKHRGSPPPPKVLIRPSGKVELLDGNHRTRFWMDNGYDAIPAWVIDQRRGIKIDDALNRERPESGEAYEKLSRLRINADLGQENTAALVTPKGKILIGDWHTELYKESGYGDKGGEAKFFKEGGVRIRAQNNESHIEFSQIDPATVERVTNAIHALPGREVTLEYMPLGLGKGTLFSLGDKARALADLDMWARRRGAGPQHGSAAYWHQQGDMAFNRQNPWYLKSERLISEKMRGPMPADDLQKMLQSGGIKEDEMKWTGLDDFLRSKGKGKVTPDEIRDFLDFNALQIEEVHKGNHPGAPTRDQMAMSEYDKPYAQLDPQQQHWVDVVTNNDSPSTKFGNWVLPGGENYRELMFTVPRKGVGKLMEDWRVPAGHMYHEDLADNRRIGHVRFNERTGPNGEKLLHLEEVQSDRLQAGRKKGFKEPIDKMELTAKEVSPGWYEVNTSNGQFVTNVTYSGSMTPEAAIKEARRRLHEEPRATSESSKVPDTPFKSTWQELMLRRMVQYASENGFDGLAWTPGAAQAERYDLSQHIDSLRYSPYGNGTFEVDAVKDGHIVQSKIGTPQQLEEFVGKDVVQKITNGEGRDWYTALGTTPSGKELVGVDLKVGGEGMHGFYDKIVPEYLNKFGKKWGARVGETKISLSPKLGSDVSIVDDHGLFVVNDANEPHEQPLAEFDTLEEAKTYVKALGGEKKNVPYIPITPEMRDSLVREGVPMFRREKAPKGKQVKTPTPKTDLREQVSTPSVVKSGTTKTVWNLATIGALKGEVLQNSPHKVEAPDGKTYVFPDLDSLNHFRNEAGIEK